VNREHLTPPAGPGAGLLIRGDNLDAFARLPEGIADLIATDPPFATGRQRTSPSNAHLAFGDVWRDLDHYLEFIEPRLHACRRLLAAQGTLLIHLDYRAIHHVKLLLDRIFGASRFINEIIWHYTGGGRSRRRFSRKHDTLLWYAKGDRWTFNIDAVRVPYKPTSGYARGGIVSRSGKRYRPHPDGTPIDDVWDIPMVNPLSPERCGYPAQKPERLLERIVAAMSNPGDLVVDPFCGSGTAAVVAARQGRRWIACDCQSEAVACARRRLEKSGAEFQYVHICADRVSSPQPSKRG